MSKIKVVAEIGINHNGDIEIAKRMIDEAKAAGADAVKFQRRTIDKCYTQEELSAAHTSAWGDTIRAKVYGRELRQGDWNAIDEHCKRADIEWSASCWDWESFLRHERFDPPWHKIAGTMALNEAFVRGVASRQKLTLISTGILNFQQTCHIAQVFEAAGCPYVILHCVGLYPCPPNRLQLRAIETLRLVFMNDSAFPHCKGIGYSGHEVGLSTTIGAVALGASWVERHFTLDRSMYGTDQSASIEPQGLQHLVKWIRTMEVALGDGQKTITGDEKRAITVGIRDWL